MNSEINFKFEIDKTTVRLLVILAALIVIIVTASHSVVAQEVTETIRINTRVVFMDALVKDKRTGVAIKDLKPENFEIYDNGTLRPVSYFTREGQARKPLALVLILDLRDDGAGRFLKRPEILKAMADELAKLSPEDEVAILAMDINGEDEKRVWLTEFTRDHKQVVAALARAPQFVDVDPEDADAKAGKLNNQSDGDRGASLTIGSDSDAKAKAKEAPKDSSGPGPGTPQSDQDPKVEITKGKNGVTTRTVHPDGSVDIKRQNKKGDVTLEVSSIYDMAAAVQDTTRKTQKERPNSQLAVVWVSDGIAPIFFEDREATEQLVLRSNVIFNSLTTELRTLFKLLMPIGKPIAGMMGVSVYGSAKRLAQQSGGEAVKVSHTKDYAAGLSRIIGNLTARYSLGFTLAEDEKDNGQLHNLELKVKAPDAKGKLRKLEVSSRRGYYLSATAPGDAKAATAAKTQ
ncbi:MAG TPA: VWA domain-containing protein [Pyrinomonadaceae bacterium]|jgi:VWFA-related protein|nr:VWA domain-containing protein [Pyrinomonadaceae bacterium]